MDRRDFLGWVGVGSVASCLPIALAACRSDQAEAPPVSESPGGSQTVGTLATLEQEGRLLNENVGGGPVLAIRNPANPEAIVAVNPTCPHAGCLVDWNNDQQVFVCPCHDSQFAPDGSLIQGPADRSLQTYSATVEQDAIVLN
ncbi:cytochrome B6 [filamentous cyanobacterium CCP2]|nr:cytochrome B6 [filamentous cyanobacterium CCP2]